MKNLSIKSNCYRLKKKAQEAEAWEKRERQMRCTVCGNVFCYTYSDIKANNRQAGLAVLSAIGTMASVVGGTRYDIFLVIYGRMIEVYLVTSIGPIPFATMVNREWGQTGQNYLRSLLALGFQAFLIMICVGIYAVLVENIAIGDDITVAIWECLGYTVLLCYTLFKTGSLAKSLFGAH